MGNNSSRKLSQFKCSVPPVSWSNRRLGAITPAKSLLVKVTDLWHRSANLTPLFARYQIVLHKVKYFLPHMSRDAFFGKFYRTGAKPLAKREDNLIYKEKAPQWHRQVLDQGGSLDMKREIYLDNSATTQVSPEVSQAVVEVMTRNYGNPSAMHKMGLAAAQIVQQSRQSVAGIIGAKPDEIFFCSGGTEANNWAIQGIVRSKRANLPGRIITSLVEHASVLKTCQVLGQQGYQVTFLPVNALGIVDPKDVEQAITKDTVLLSLMHVNNETGAIQPIQEVGKILRQYPQIVFHVDGVQSFGKLPCDVGRFGVHLLSLSGHKIHGPKGIGALYIRSGTRIAPYLWGGEQENSLRAGTENVPGIAGFGTAAHIAGRHMDDYSKVVGGMRRTFWEIISARLDGTKVNSPMNKNGAPHILNLSFEGIKAEVLLRVLQDRGIFASSGSACHSRRTMASHVLSAMGMQKKHLESTLRFSFSLLNTKEEISIAADQVSEAVAELRSL